VLLRQQRDGGGASDSHSLSLIAQVGGLTKQVLRSTAYWAVGQVRRCSLYAAHHGPECANGFFLSKITLKF
jgi:hypothetical protein